MDVQPDEVQDVVKPNDVEDDVKLFDVDVDVKMVIVQVDVCDQFTSNHEFVEREHML